MNYERLSELGISGTDCYALRRISMTLHRWFEGECGDSNEFGSWCIVRGKRENGSFIYDDDGASFREYHSNFSNKAEYTRIPDRETGARKRLGKIIANYPGLTVYVQTDPRGAALYIMRTADIRARDVSSIYSSIGVAVY